MIATVLQGKSCVIAICIQKAKSWCKKTGNNVLTVDEVTVEVNLLLEVCTKAGASLEMKEHFLDFIQAKKTPNSYHCTSCPKV
jgi:hypothetical protein